MHHKFLGTNHKMLNLFDDCMWFYFTRELKEKAPINLILSIACFWNYAEEIIETNLLQYFREFSYTLIHSFRVVFRLRSNQDHTCLEGSKLVELNFYLKVWLERSWNCLEFHLAWRWEALRILVIFRATFASLQLIARWLCFTRHATCTGLKNFNVIRTTPSTSPSFSEFVYAQNPSTFFIPAFAAFLVKMVNEGCKKSIVGILIV